MSPLSSRKKIERLRRFFRFMVKRGWLKVSPAAEIEGPVVKFKQRMPFTDEKIEKVMWATEVYSIKGIYGKANRARARAFVRLLLLSGLRISDAVTLDVSRFQSKDKLLIPTHKTASPSFCRYRLMCRRRFGNSENLIVRSSSGLETEE